LSLIDNTDKETLIGVQISINEALRPLGTNSTIIELYDTTKNELIQKNEYKWNTINGIKLKNGDYKIVTYFQYLKKDWGRTENIIKVQNNMTNIEIKYPLLVTGKAKLKINGIKTKPNN